MITLIRHTRAGVRSVRFGNWGVACVMLLGLSVLSAAVAAGYLLAVTWHPNGVVSEITVKNWQKELKAQRDEVEHAKRESQEQLQALAMRVAKVQAHMTRVDAVGMRVTELVGLDEKEFDFSGTPAMGGPDASVRGAVETSPMEFISQLDAMNSQLDTRGRQLAVLESLLLDKHMGTEKAISGKPTDIGYITSYFGYRTDPMHGGAAWHNGLDFAAAEGTEIHATAAGVVSFAGVKDGYGNVVEINHGDGLVTRYAHNHSLQVRLGELVRKGQVIARMGSTGRSTAPHVHYEVLRDGLFLNPAKYLGG